MANICEYKVYVKGKKTACYAFLGAMPQLEDYEILMRKESPESGVEFGLSFVCCCKWAVDAYTHEDNETSVVKSEDIPTDITEAIKFGEKFYPVNLRSKSRILDVEVYCVSIDLDDPIELYADYIVSGVTDYTVEYEDFPEEIKMPEYEKLLIF